MASSLSGIFSRIWKPKIYSLVPPITATGMQVREYAARRGTREKALKKKIALKLKRAALEAKQKPKILRTTSASDVEKTMDSSLPPPPECNVFYSNLYQPVEYSMIEALKFHKEDLHPSVLNQPGVGVNIVIELDMTGEKKTKTIKPWSNVIIFPYPFGMGISKKILVICPEDQREMALEAGADFAGGSTLMKNIKKGTFDIAGFDSIVGSVALHDEINLIRAHLKLLHPKKANGTLTDDIVSSIQRIKYGIQYSSHLSDKLDKFGWVKLSIGKLTMTDLQLEENLITLLNNVNGKRPKRGGDFITHVYSSCPPSKEKIKINFRRYLEERENDKSSEVETPKVSVAASN